MHTEFDGQAIALQRIAAEARDRTGFLDLTQLGLTELPEKLFGLTHLRRLHLGRRMVQYDGVWREVRWGSPDPPNRLADFGRLVTFLDLEALSVAGTDCDSLDFVSTLTALQSLDCSGTQVSDLGPLATLTALQSLDCSDTRVSDLGPLATLTALQSLACSYTQVSDLGPLATLPRCNRSIAATPRFPTWGRWRR